MVRAEKRRACVWALLFSLFHFSSGQIVYSVAEESEPGTVVGNLAKDLNLGLQEMEGRNFHVAPGPNKRYLDVNLKTGMLLVGQRIDRDTLCGRSAKCVLQLEAIVNSPPNLFQFEVNLLDINDNAPVFRTLTKHLNISENAFPGERFTLPKASDADVGNNGVKSYKLSTNEHFSLDVQSDGEQSASAELVLQKPLDREKQSAVRLLLTALDGGKPARSGTLQITISVLDVNDNVPVFNKSLYKARIPENAPRGLSVITVQATDLDEGPNGEVTYSFINHDSDTTVDIFAIDKSSGEITVKGELDYEATPAIEIRVQAKDKGPNPRAAHCKVLIEIIDLNDNAPEISVTSLISNIKEDAAVGTMVGLISVKDSDGGKNGAVHCKINQSGVFKLQSSYKNSYSLVVDGPLDRETVSQYNISITATDEGSPPLTSSTVISVHVSDVNDNAPRFSGSQMYAYIKENSPVGSLIQTVSAFDVDEKENAQITYALLESDNRVRPTSTLVNMNSLTGEIYALQTFNYEEMKMFQFRVQATDSGVPPLSSNVTVNVFILDENDNRPGILAPYSEQGSVNTESIPYSAESGYFVAKIRAVDADSGYNALLSYHMSEPKGSNLFRIGSSNGEIRTKRRMSDNDLRTHPLVIVVCDSGEPSLSATVSVDVLVVESSGETQTSFGQRPSKEESISDLNVYLLIAIVSVCVIFVLSLIGVVAVKCHRTEEDFSSYGAPVITTHPDGSWSYSKSTQQYDVCFSSDTLKSDVVVFPAPCGPADAELISINGGDTFKPNQTLPSRDKVKAQDGGAPPLSRVATVYLYVMDQNDHPPEIISPPANGSRTTETVMKNTEAGHLVTKVVAYDADAGQNAWLVFALEQVSEPDLFKVHEHTGEVRTIRKVVEDNSTFFSLTVVVHDHGLPPLSATVTLNVAIMEAPPKMTPDSKRIMRPDTGLLFSNVTRYLIVALSATTFVFLVTVVVLAIVRCHAYCSQPGSCSPCCISQKASAEGSSGGAAVGSGQQPNNNVVLRRDLKVEPHYIEVRGNGSLTKTYCYKTCLTATSGSDTFMFYNTGMPPGGTMGSERFFTGQSGQMFVRRLSMPDASVQPKPPNADWRYSASLRAGMKSSVHMEESSVLQGAQGVLVQNWPTVSSGADAEGGEVSPQVAAGMNSNSWHFRYGPGPGPPQHLKPGEVPEAFIIPGSPAIISIRPEQADAKDEAKKKKKKKKGKDKKEKGKDESEQ